MKLRGTSSAFSDIIHIAWALLRGASLPMIQSRLYSLVYASHLAVMQRN